MPRLNLKNVYATAKQTAKANSSLLPDSMQPLSYLNNILKTVTLKKNDYILSKTDTSINSRQDKKNN